MNRLYAILLLAISSIFAQAQPMPDDVWKADIHLTANDAASRRLEAHINQQLRFALRNAARATPQKVAGIAERLIAQADFDFTINALEDSVTFSYSNGRGSSFNYDDLAFEFDNPFDFPTNGPGKWPEIQFDSMFRYVYAGAWDWLYGARTYNASGKPVMSLLREDSNRASILSFEYNQNSLLAKVTFLELEMNSGRIDSLFRDFYTYNSSGFLIRDSGESWNGSAWAPSSVVVLTPNAAGYPTLVQTYYSGHAMPDDEWVISYTPNNQRALVIKRWPLVVGGPLVSTFKDSFAYVGTMLSVYDNYRWDTTSQTWLLYQTSHSRLNSSGLRDSVVRITYPKTGSPYVSVRKLTYDSFGNPTVEYYSNDNGLYAVRHFYYETYNTLGVQATEEAAMDIYVYPNPASSVLKIHGFNAGQYSILNSLGQTVQSGQFDGKAIQLSPELPYAQYFLQLNADNGLSRTVPFRRE